jgi:hypothetical protein
VPVGDKLKEVPVVEVALGEGCASKVPGDLETPALLFVVFVLLALDVVLLHPANRVVAASATAANAAILSFILFSWQRTASQHPLASAATLVKSIIGLNAETITLGVVQA